MLESGDITVFYLPSCYFVISISAKKKCRYTIMHTLLFLLKKVIHFNFVYSYNVFCYLVWV